MVLNFKDKRIRGIFEQYVDDILHKRREGFLDREQEEKISLLENEIRSVIDKYQNPHFQKIISQAIGESAYRASEVYEKSRKLYDSTLEFKDHDDGNSGFELNDGLNDFSDEYILERASETAKSINENLGIMIGGKYQLYPRNVLYNKKNSRIVLIDFGNWMRVA